MKDGVLQRFFGGPKRLAPVKLQELLEEALTDPRGGRNEWLNNLRHVDDLIQILYNIGFLKARGQGKTWQSARDPDFSIILAEEFAVHPAFHRYLRIGHRG